jgi:PKHD-type hydroxylase
MILKNNYWFFKNAISHKICDDIINLAKTKKEAKGLIGIREQKESEKLLKDKKYKKQLKQKRNSNIVWLDEMWIYDIINQLIHAANKNAGWNFEINWNEPCQFTIYKKGQFYGWHEDGYVDPYNVPNDLNSHGKIRKLSLVMSLSEPSDYKGGNLMFKILGEDKNTILKCDEIKSRGSVVVFPSFIKHKVTPVTSGTRYSLVNWSIGYPFK